MPIVAASIHPNNLFRPPCHLPRRVSGVPSDPGTAVPDQRHLRMGADRPCPPTYLFHVDEHDTYHRVSQASYYDSTSVRHPHVQQAMQLGRARETRADGEPWLPAKNVQIIMLIVDGDRSIRSVTPTLKNPSSFYELNCSPVLYSQCVQVMYSSYAVICL